MTTIHAQVVGDQVVLPRGEWDQLVLLARKADNNVEVYASDDDLPALGLTILARDGKAFDWLKDEDDLYSLADLKVRYR